METRLDTYSASLSWSHLVAARAHRKSRFTPPAGSCSPPALKRPMRRFARPLAFAAAPSGNSSTDGTTRLTVPKMGSDVSAVS
jgi:hypothetical protein